MGIFQSLFSAFAGPPPIPGPRFGPQISAGPSPPRAPDERTGALMSLDDATLRAQSLGKTPWIRPEDSQADGILDPFPKTTRVEGTSESDDFPGISSNLNYDFAPPDSEMWRMDNVTWGFSSDPPTPDLWPEGPAFVEWIVFRGGSSSENIAFRAFILLGMTGPVTWLPHGVDVARPIRNITIMPKDILRVVWSIRTWTTAPGLETTYFLKKAKL